MSLFAKSKWHRRGAGVRERSGDRPPHPAARNEAGKRSLLFLMVLLLLPLLLSCRQPAAADEAPDTQIVLAPGPDSLVVGRITFDLTLWDAEGQPIDGADPVTLRGDMNHAGMRPVLARATGMGDGQYTTDFEWTMAGDWTVTVEATLPDGRVKRATFPFTVAAVE